MQYTLLVANDFEFIFFKKKNKKKRTLIQVFYQVITSLSPSPPTRHADPRREYDHRPLSVSRVGYDIDRHELHRLVDVESQPTSMRRRATACKSRPDQL